MNGKTPPVSAPDPTATSRSGRTALHIFLASTPSGALVGFVLGLAMAAIRFAADLVGLIRAGAKVHIGILWAIVGSEALFAARSLCELTALGALGGVLCGGIASILCRKVVRERRLLRCALGWGAGLGFLGLLVVAAVGWDGTVAGILADGAVLGMLGMLSGAAYGVLLVILAPVAYRALASQWQRILLSSVLGALYAAGLCRPFFDFSHSLNHVGLICGVGALAGAALGFLARNPRKRPVHGSDT